MGALSSPQSLYVRCLGTRDYQSVWQDMIDFTERRDESTADEIWLVQHPPVFTLGRNGKKEHLVNVSDIPVIETDRGGQVTYHAFGQLIAYVLIDIRRRNIGIRQLVTILEESIISLLAKQKIEAISDPKAPGVYVQGAKIAALGLRIRNGKSYHGLSLNIDMDLSPFKQINPCGYQGLEVTQCHNLGYTDSVDQIAEDLINEHLSGRLGYSHHQLFWDQHCPDQYS